MFRFGTVLLMSASLLASAPAWAQTPPPRMSDLMKPPKDAPPPRMAQLGPYAVTVEAAPGLPSHTLYRPTDLTKIGKSKLPIVAWGNGGCAPIGRMFESYLRDIASHGYVVVVNGSIDGKMGDMSAPPSRAAQLIQGVDWAISENGRAGSPLRGKLDPKAIGVAGQSCGGLQAIVASADPRVRASLILNSGVMNDSSNRPPGMAIEATKDSLTALHAPIAYIIGGPTDIAFANAEDDFVRLDGVSVFSGNLNVGHGGTFQHPNGGWFGDISVAWLDWRLKGDNRAGAVFEGPACGLCTDPAWTVKKKNIR